MMRIPARGGLALLCCALALAAVATSLAFVPPCAGGRGALLPRPLVQPARGISAAAAAVAPVVARRRPEAVAALAASGAGDDNQEPEEEMETVEFAAEASVPMDIVLARRFPELSRRACRRLLQEGRVLVNGKVMKRFAKPGRGAAISVTLPKERMASKSIGMGFALEPEEMELTILYEDEHLLAVGKGPGVVVQPCESARTGTLLHGVMHHLTAGVEPPLAPILTSPTQGVVHRLDKDTSGVWLYAKSKPVSARLSAQFKTRAVAKTYLAICHGDPCAAASTGGKGDRAAGKGPAGTELVIDQPIFRKANGKMAVPATAEERAKARRAVSKVETLMTDGKMSLVRVQILTGRTHQIRVHLAHLDCPVLGDDVYCDVAFTRRNTRFRRLGLKRILLHAYELAFRHPITGDLLDLLAPMPTDMLATVQYILREAKPLRAVGGGGGGQGESSKEAAQRRLLRALRDGKPLTEGLMAALGLRAPGAALRPVEGPSGEEEDEEDEDEEDDDEDEEE